MEIFPDKRHCPTSTTAWPYEDTENLLKRECWILDLLPEMRHEEKEGITQLFGDTNNCVIPSFRLLFR